MNIACDAGLDRVNAAFWSELCGTTLARSLGITDHSLRSLELFDQAYLSFYPYLLERVNPLRMAGHKVLEIGLGYGTLGQKIVEAGADYIGLDLSDGPVRMMRHRLRLCKLPGACVQGSTLNLPLAGARVDYVVSIGCFHHTGNIQRAIDETFRVLRPGGFAVIMLYNQYSLRQWLRWPRSTFWALCRDLGLTDRRMPVGDAQRRAYDANKAGQAPPETVFSSVRQLRAAFSAFRRVEFHKENTDGIVGLPRRMLLSYFGPWAGLDIYVEAQK